MAEKHIKPVTDLQLLQPLKVKGGSMSVTEFMTLLKHYYSSYENCKFAVRRLVLDGYVKQVGAKWVLTERGNQYVDGTLPADVPELPFKMDKPGAAVLPGTGRSAQQRRQIEEDELAKPWDGIKEKPLNPPPVVTPELIRKWRLW